MKNAKIYKVKYASKNITPLSVFINRPTNLGTTAAHFYVIQRKVIDY